MIETTVAGERLLLLSERAIYWPRAAALVVADVHFGKAASFRTLGVPVPRGTTATDIQRLSRLIAQHSPERLLILGDLLHASTGRAERTMAAIAAWRAEHSQLQIMLVRGNHDHRAGDPPEDWQIACSSEPVVEGPFVFRHEPEADDRGYVLCGHVHPSVTLSDRAGGHLRTRCFYFGQQIGILPAFGRFTGTHTITPQVGDRIFAVGPDEIIELKGKEQ